MPEQLFKRECLEKNRDFSSTTETKNKIIIDITQNILSIYLAFSTSKGFVVLQTNRKRKTIT